MTDAQKALDDAELVTCLGHLTNFAHNHSEAIMKALRLLAAVEAGTHKVVPVNATAENGMKYKLIGELRYDRTYTDDDGNERDIKFELSWPETKEAYIKLLLASPDFFSKGGK